jgi:hypothetical protein
MKKLGKAMVIQLCIRGAVVTPNTPAMNQVAEAIAIAGSLSVDQT